VTGILAVELFETTDGRVLVNELAMRPHNTGHWSQDGADDLAVREPPAGGPRPAARLADGTSPLDGDGQHPGRTRRRRPAVEPAIRTRWRATRALRVHLYGKDLRPGRKVGHVNAYGDDLADCLARARHAAAWFAGELGEHSE
jgi:5-(carboxyamino)imidazole ribonucleotide synthase